ncbi:hypothetical protein FACS189454_09360 [Planctomycetales bacterium]|nr:hypothetical protein FACS189454_09360 [Planctomycetales bacterium]
MCYLAKKIIGADYKLQTEIIAEGKNRDYSTATLKRAKAMAGIQSQKGDEHFDGKWCWYNPAKISNDKASKIEPAG